MNKKKRLQELSTKNNTRKNRHKIIQLELRLKQAHLKEAGYRKQIIEMKKTIRRCKAEQQTIRSEVQRTLTEMRKLQVEG